MRQTGRTAVSLGDDTFTRVAVHTKYCFHWHYLFTLKMWCTIWTRADCGVHVIQSLNPNTRAALTRREH